MPQEIVSQFDRKYGLPIETNRSVQNISQRNAIPEAVRWEGMIVHVIGDQSYILLNGIDNTEWEPLGGLVDVNVVDNLLSTSPTDALSANQGRVLKDLIDNIDTSVNWGEIGGTLADQTDLQTALNGKEPAFSKNTAFNKNFGTTAGTVSEGNHTHTFASITGKPTTISGYGITDAYTESEVDTLLSGKLGVSAKAADSELLDGINSTQFLRSDQNDTMTGVLSLQQSGALGLILNRTSTANIGIEFQYDGSDYSRLFGYGGTYAFRFFSTANNIGNWFPNGDLEVNGDVKGGSFSTTNWEIVETAGVLQFKYSGVVKFEMQSDGIIEAADTFKQGIS